MPTARHVSLVQKLRWHVTGNISPTAFAIGDVDGHGDNAFVIGNLVGELFVFKGNHPEGLPWLTCKGLGTITAVAIGDIRNWGKNSIVVMSAEGLCHIFDISGLDEGHHIQNSGSHLYQSSSSVPGMSMSTGQAMSGATEDASRPGHTGSIYSSTPAQGSYQGGGHNGVNLALHLNIPATPSIRPVPDHHHHSHSQHHQHHGSHLHAATSSLYHGTPPLPPPPQNTPHGSASSSVSGFPHHNSHHHSQLHTPNNTPIHSHAGSIHGGAGGPRRGSEVFLGPSGPGGSGSMSASASVARTTAVLANLIGTPPTSMSHTHGASIPASVARSIGGNSAANSPTGTPLLKPQHVFAPTSGAPSSRKQQGNGAQRDGNTGKLCIQHVGGRRVLDRPNLTLPVPVNINRAYIADIDGDGLNEIVLARTDRILHSYSLQSSKATSPTTTSAQPSNQQLSLVKLLSRTSSISTLDSSGLLSPSDERREIIIHYPSLSSMGKLHYAGSTPNVTGAGTSQADLDSHQSQHPQDSMNGCDPSSHLVLVEKKRWALDGQIHCLAVTKDTQTGLPILLVAQPGLKFVMVDHAGNMTEPVTQIQRNPDVSVNVVGPDTPTRVAGSGDVATDIICGSHYVNGKKKDIIGLMSMDGAFALHDLESNTVKVHDLDSTHKIFGFSKLNFGRHYLEQQQQNQARSSRQPRRSSYGRPFDGRYADESNYDGGEDDDDDQDDEDDVDTEDDGYRAAETQTLQNQSVGGGGGYFSDMGDNSISRRADRSGRTRSRKARARGEKPAVPSMLVSDPFGSRFQSDDMFVGCSWSGVTFFIDQNFNTAQYDFDARVCAFGAGQYAVTPGRNEPCLFYVDFEDNIYVYHNLYIQTEPPPKFQDVLNADASLKKRTVLTDRVICYLPQVHASQQAKIKSTPKAQGASGVAEECSTATGALRNSNLPKMGTDTTVGFGAMSSDVGDTGASTAVKPIWSEGEMKEFVHESLYDVNRYENEYQRLKRLTNLERAKRMAFLQAEADKERERWEKEWRTATAESKATLSAEAEAATAAAVGAERTKDSPTFVDPRLRRSPHALTVDTLEAHELKRSLGKGKAAQTGPGHDLSTDRNSGHSLHYTQAHHRDNDVEAVSPLSPLSTASLPSPKPTKIYTEKRRSSLLIKDVLSHYEGKITPPLKSPTSPSASSSLMSKDYRNEPATSSTLQATAVSGGSSTTLTNIIKRFSLKDLGNGGRLSRSSSSGSGSGSGSGSSQSTITQGHPLLGAPVLTKGKASAAEPRIGKSALRVNRPAITSSRTRTMSGVMGGRKLGARSRLSLQQDREEDTTEDGDDDEDVDAQGAPSEDGALETDGDNLTEFDRASRKSAGDDDFRAGPQDYDSELTAENFFRAGLAQNEAREEGAAGRGAEVGEGALVLAGGDEDITGVYTPSTISPIPSPGRIYGGQQQGSLAEPSASLDSSGFMLARSLLSPSSRSISAGNTASASIGTINVGAMGKTSRQPEHDKNHNGIGYSPLSSSSSTRGGSHTRQRSGHGLLDVIGMPMRDNIASASSSGLNSGPNSAGHSSIPEGRRSRAESVLSTGSDIGGMIVPDITLMASSFPTQPTFPLSTSEPLSHAMVLPDESDGEMAENDNEHLDDLVMDEHFSMDQERQSMAPESRIHRPPRRSSTLGSQDGTSASDIATVGSDGKPTGGNSHAQRPSRSGAEGMRVSLPEKRADVKLMPAPLPRSSQHHQRQQLEQQASSGDIAENQQQQHQGGALPLAHVSFSSDTRPNAAGTSGTSGQGDGAEGQRRGNDGYGRGIGGKSSSTTSSATVSDFGSGPSSPHTNVTVANAILSNPSSNSYKGFSVLSLPVTSPSASTATGQQHQYFSSSHHHHPPPLLHHQQPFSMAVSGGPNSGSSAKGTHPYDRGVGLEDDRASIRSRTSTFHDTNDISTVLATTTSCSGHAVGGQQGLYNLNPASTSTSHLVSDSLVRRLEELQQQDRDVEERQRQKEKDAERERGKERSRTHSSSQSISSIGTGAAAATTGRPSALSRVNSNASVQSSVSQVSHRVSITSPMAPPHSSLPTHPPTSTGSVSGSGPVSSLGAASSGPVSGTGPLSGSSTAPPSGAGGRGHYGWDDDQHDAAKRFRSRPGLGADR
ncbi:integrin alpha FG-GAP repeat-containing protein 2 [Mortierella claussenii]|nr:integrin alpha FG-GAP repeat-containing protein 2 [Mortierella claussenii]